MTRRTLPLALLALFSLASCMTAGLWSTEHHSRSEVAEALAVHREPDGRWLLQLPPAVAAASGEWIAVTPKEHGEAFAELARLASAAEKPELVSLSVSIEQTDAEQPWTTLLATEPARRVGLGLWLAAAQARDLHPCDGLRQSDHGDSVYLHASSLCTIAAASPPPDPATRFRGAGTVRVNRPDEVAPRFGLAERVLMTPVTLVVDVVTIPLLPLAGLYVAIAMRYVQS